MEIDWGTERSTYGVLQWATDMRGLATRDALGKFHFTFRMKNGQSQLGRLSRERGGWCINITRLVVGKLARLVAMLCGRQVVGVDCESGWDAFALYFVQDVYRVMKYSCP